MNKETTITWNSQRVSIAYLLAAIAAIGCASAQVTPEPSNAPITSGPPTQVVVYDFAVTHPR